MKDSVAIGLFAEIRQVVGPQHLVSHHNPGGPQVLASPWMLYLMEFAAYNALRPHLDEGEDSVGVGFQFEHLAPTPVGHEVVARAWIDSIRGPVVNFRVEAEDHSEIIGRGMHARAVIELERFNRRVQRKVASA
jgi:predicted thioesterase